MLLTYKLCYDLRVQQTSILLMCVSVCVQSLRNQCWPPWSTGWRRGSGSAPGVGRRVQTKPGYDVTQRQRVSHETWHLVKSFECYLSHTLLDIKAFLQFISFKKCLTHIFYCEINFTITYNKCYQSLQYQTTYQIMEEDILNYSKTAMFRLTPCT